MFMSVTIAGETEPPPYLSRKDADASGVKGETLTAIGDDLAEAIKSSSKTSPSDPDRLVYHIARAVRVVESFKRVLPLTTRLFLLLVNFEKNSAEWKT